MDEPSWAMPGIQSLTRDRTPPHQETTPWGMGSHPADPLPTSSPSFRGVYPSDQRGIRQESIRYPGDQQRYPRNVSLSSTSPHAYSQPDLAASTRQWVNEHAGVPDSKRQPVRCDIHAQAGCHPGGPYARAASAEAAFQLPEHLPPGDDFDEGPSGMDVTHPQPDQRSGLMEQGTHISHGCHLITNHAQQAFPQPEGVLSARLPDLDAQIRRQQLEQQQRQQFQQQLPDGAFQGFSPQPSGRRAAVNDVLHSQQQQQQQQQQQEDSHMHTYEKNMPVQHHRGLNSLPGQSLQLPASSREILRKAYGTPRATPARPMIDPAHQVGMRPGPRSGHQSFPPQHLPEQQLPLQSRVVSANLAPNPRHPQQVAGHEHGHAANPMPAQTHAMNTQNQPVQAQSSHKMYPQPRHAQRNDHMARSMLDHPTQHLHDNRGGGFQQAMTSSPPVFDCSRALELQPALGWGPSAMTVQHSMPIALPDFHARPAVLHRSNGRSASRTSSPNPAGNYKSLTRPQSYELSFSVFW